MVIATKQLCVLWYQQTFAFSPFSHEIVWYDYHIHFVNEQFHRSLPLCCKKYNKGECNLASLMPYLCELGLSRKTEPTIYIIIWEVVGKMAFMILVSEWCFVILLASCSMTQSRSKSLRIRKAVGVTLIRRPKAETQGATGLSPGVRRLAGLEFWRPKQQKEILLALREKRVHLLFPFPQAFDKLGGPSHSEGRFSPTLSTHTLRKKQKQKYLSRFLAMSFT